MHRKIFSYSMCTQCLFKIFFMHLYACMEFLHCSKFQLKWCSSVLSISRLKWSLIPLEQVTEIQILTRTRTWLNQMIMGWELANLIFCFCSIGDHFFFFWIIATNCLCHANTAMHKFHSWSANGLTIYSSWILFI